MHARAGDDTAAVSDAQLVQRQDLIVELDYGQFYLHTAEVDPELVPEVLERALDGDGIAESDGVLVVESPHQNNFEMPLVVEVWDGPTTDDLPEWQEAFEAHLEVGHSGLLYGSPTMDSVEIDVPLGLYHALITGRGFVARGWPGSTEPGDEWRIRLWPSREVIAPRRVKQWTGEAGTPSERTAGRADTRQGKRMYDMTDPARRQLIERVDALTPPSAAEYADVHVDPESEILEPGTIFLVVRSQLRLVLEGPDIESIDPHGYLRRARESIATLVCQLTDERARRLRDLDALIYDSLAFDAADRERAGLPTR